MRRRISLGSAINALRAGKFARSVGPDAENVIIGAVIEQRAEALERVVRQIECGAGVWGVEIERWHASTMRHRGTSFAFV